MDNDDGLSWLQEQDAELEQELHQVSGSEVEHRESLLRHYLDRMSSSGSRRPGPVEFPSTWDWPNVDRSSSCPISLNTHLVGRITVLDFFTYCCINCLHVLPDLAALEQSFDERELLIIGVHSAKFDNEKASGHIRSAIHRHQIRHPVVNDTTASLWNKMGIVCWPTLLILDPQGRPIKFFMGEGNRQPLMLFVRVALDYYRSRNQISRTADVPRLLHYPDESISHPDDRLLRLRFPGKVTLTLNRIAISDCGHHRVVLADLASHRVVRIIGDGVPGFKDGPAKTARFSSPQGVCFSPDEEFLFVCDTSNNALRKVDLKSGLVSTLQLTSPLSSPWDVCLGCSPGSLANQSKEQQPKFDVLFVAVAGSHQIWTYCLDDVTWWKNQPFSRGSDFCLAGSGREENRNNSYPHKASFAQPSGLCFNAQNGLLYVADSESSSIRCISVLNNGCVQGLVGGSRDPTDLFAFGDLDGPGIEAKLQHPMAVALMPISGQLLVADSFNHKVKIITHLDSKKPLCSSLQLAPGSLSEPGGLACHPNLEQMFICDTNHHCIKKLDLLTLDVKDLQWHLDEDQVAHEEVDHNLPPTRQLILGPDRGRIRIQLQLILPDGFKLNPDMKSTWSASVPDHWPHGCDSLTGVITDANVTAIWVAYESSGSGCLEEEHQLSVGLKLFLCSSVDGLCSVRRPRLTFCCIQRPDGQPEPVFQCKLDL